MRKMPTIISTNPMHSDVLPNEGVEIPRIPADEWNARLFQEVGELTPGEREFVDRAVAHNWTLIVIADAIRERRFEAKS